MFFRTTDEDGRCPGLISREAFTPGMYKLRFETGSYWESLGQTSFFPYVEVRGGPLARFITDIQKCCFKSTMCSLTLKGCFEIHLLKEGKFLWAHLVQYQRKGFPVSISAPYQTHIIIIRLYIIIRIVFCFKTWLEWIFKYFFTCWQFNSKHHHIITKWFCWQII